MSKDRRTEFNRFRNRCKFHALNYELPKESWGKHLCEMRPKYRRCNEDACPLRHTQKEEKNDG